MLDAWWQNLGEEQLEELTGYSIADYQDEEEFLSDCDDWWDAKSQKEKQRLFVDANKPS